jgi:hypothetical protein
MRLGGLTGICPRRKGRHRVAPAVHDDLVRRRFVADHVRAELVVDALEMAKWK